LDKTANAQKKEGVNYSCSILSSLVCGQR